MIFFIHQRKHSMAYHRTYFLKKKIQLLQFSVKKYSPKLNSTKGQIKTLLFLSLKLKFSSSGFEIDLIWYENWNYFSAKKKKKYTNISRLNNKVSMTDLPELSTSLYIRWSSLVNSISFSIQFDHLLLIKVFILFTFNVIADIFGLKI